MGEKSEIAPTAEPVQVFRQFAWNLAGTLARGGPARPSVRGTKPTVKR